jgi:hypothetical protein
MVSDADRLPLRHPDARILIFAKAPVPGQVKTRLIPALGPEGAARLAEVLLERLVTGLASARLAHLELWCAPDTRHPVFVRLAAREGLGRYPQRGADLGERLRAGAEDALTRGGRVLLIGADIPDLDAGYCEQALEALRSVDCVLGPAEDGGYVLLGLKRPAPLLFERMPWGTDAVGRLTRIRIQRLGWRHRELPSLWDLDRPDDLGRAWRGGSSAWSMTPPWAPSLRGARG